MSDIAINFHFHHMLLISLQAPLTSDSHTESQTLISDVKKRKQKEEESQEETPPKKIVPSSSSKLMAFAFKKS
jgi:hypothetical protein